MSGDLTTRILIDLRDEMRARFDAVDARFDAVDARLAHVEQKVSILAKITHGMDTRLTRMEAASTLLARRVEVIEEKI